MTEPILTRDQILKIVRKTLKENNDRDKLSSESFMKLVAALEEAWLEKVCGELVAHTYRRKDCEHPIVARSVEEMGGDIDMYSETWERLEALYALTRSKP